MPEATVNEDHFAEAWKDDIGGSRQVSSMQTKPVTKGVSQAAHKNLWLRVLPLNAGHQDRAFRRRDDIHNDLSMYLELNYSWSRGVVGCFRDQLHKQLLAKAKDDGPVLRHIWQYADRQSDMDINMKGG